MRGRDIVVEGAELKTERLSKMPLERIFWQVGAISKHFSQLRPWRGENKVKICVQSFRKYSPYELGSSAINKKILFQKANLMRFFSINMRLCGFNFFEISGDRPILKKRKNVNMNIGLSGVFYPVYTNKNLNKLFSTLIFWRTVLGLIRKNFRLQTGYKKKLIINKNQIRVTIINPLFIDAYLGYSPDRSFENLEKSVVRIIISYPRKSVLRELYTHI